jgi:hypothetical protein
VTELDRIHVAAGIAAIVLGIFTVGIVLLCQANIIGWNGMHNTIVVFTAIILAGAIWIHMLESWDNAKRK